METKNKNKKDSFGDETRIQRMILSFFFLSLTLYLIYREKARENQRERERKEKKELREGGD